MLKKLSVALGVLAAAYVGGSYYVGVRAEDQILAMMSDAQTRANNELAWEQVELRHGVFTSTGSMMLVLNEVGLDDDTPVRTRIDYTIHHHLTWRHLAHFVWSVTPDTALAKQLESLYPQTPSLTGEGSLAWSGVATSSMAWPGVDKAATGHGLLTIAPLAGTVTVSENSFDLNMGVPEFEFESQGSAERLQLKGLAYEARSNDIASGSVAVTLKLGDAVAIGEDGMANTLSDYRWHFDVTYQNEVLSFDTQKTVAALSAMGNQATNVEISLGIDGLHRTDLQELAALTDEADGQWLELSEAQQSRIQQLGLRMLARGFTLRVPAIKADIKFMGDDASQTVGLQNFSLSAQVTEPSLALGKVSMQLGELTVPEPLQIFVPNILSLEFEASNTLVDDRVDLRLKHSLGSFSQDSQSVSDVDVDVRLKGFKPNDLLVLIELIQLSQGDMTELSPLDQQRMAQIMQDTASYGLSLEVPVFKGSIGSNGSSPAQSDALALEGLELSVKLDDAATGAGMARLELKRLTASGPQMVDVPNITNYQLTANNQVIDGKVDYQLEKSIQALDSGVIKLGPSALSVRLSGLLATDLQRLSELTPAFETGLDEAQTAELAQILRRGVASGFALSIPKLQLAIDNATVAGQGDLSLKGLGEAPLANFDIGRLVKLDAELDVMGQSPWLDPFVQQGLMMGLLQTSGDMTKGQYQFTDGQLMLNGMAVPVTEFVLMANLTVQQMLAQSLPASSDNQSTHEPSARPRRAPSN